MWWLHVVDDVDHGSFVREDGGSVDAGAARGSWTVPVSCKHGGGRSTAMR